MKWTPLALILLSPVLYGNLRTCLANLTKPKVSQMRVHMHQPRHAIGDFDGPFEYLNKTLSKREEGLHLFPEAFLSAGYPLQDLVLQQSYIQAHQANLRRVSELFASQAPNDKALFLIGGIEYQFSHRGELAHIFNSVYRASPGTALVPVYRKQLLPNTDIFDELKYFTPGHKNASIRFQGKNIGLLVCEDMWRTIKAEGGFAIDPVSKWEKSGEELDCIVCFSASPFWLGKELSRVERSREISHALGAPFVYINRLGGEDGILFDGGSFAIDGEQWLAQNDQFKSDIRSFDLSSPSASYTRKSAENDDLATPWGGLLRPALDEQNPLQLPSLSHQELDGMIAAIQFGIQEYADKNGFQKFTIAFSGGIDSALVLALTHLSLRPGQNIEALYMPSQYSSPKSTQLAREMSDHLNIPLSTFPIDSLHEANRELFSSVTTMPLEGVSDENVQSRIRSTLLYAYSNQTGSIVLNTSNKSELAVGYSTLYGDSVGALSPLGDLYKTEIYQIARRINERFGEIIPREIITRPPTAELRANQQDSQALPDYPVLDPILEGLLSYDMSAQDLIKAGHSRDDVEKVFRLYQVSEHKRRQFPPIIKLKIKSFGTGYRVPISKRM